MDREIFESFVTRAVADIPDRFKRELVNVAILVEEEPSKEVLKENGVPEGGTLLGLYQGVPRTERGSDYGVGGVLPDTITVFIKPILQVAKEDKKSVETVIKETLWHEIAHYFGMEEDEVHGRESEGSNRFRAFPE